MTGRFSAAPFQRVVEIGEGSTRTRCKALRRFGDDASRAAALRPKLSARHFILPCGPGVLNDRWVTHGADGGEVERGAAQRHRLQVDLLTSAVRRLYAVVDSFGCIARSKRNTFVSPSPTTRGSAEYPALEAQTIAPLMSASGVTGREYTPPLPLTVNTPPNPTVISGTSTPSAAAEKGRQAGAVSLKLRDVVVGSLCFESCSPASWRVYPGR